ncbi:hypothetical protein [Sphingomonas sp. 3-13AW]|uniref:hypothetical protein n=1 Tax=Sphingomonas sp. 3-13AW TaxID=3050450 RepID=UPI003BB5219E
MPQHNVFSLAAVRARRSSRTRYASVADTFSVEDLIADLDDGAITGSGDYPMIIDTYVTAQPKQAA